MLSKSQKSELVAALRSGEYKQGFGVLRADNCFCVMGVATDVLLGGYWRMTKYHQRGKQVYDFHHDISGKKATTYPVVNLYNLMGEGNVKNLVRMNDSQKLTFEQFADVIEGFETRD